MKVKLKTSLALALGVWGTSLTPSAPGQSGGGDNYQALIKREFGTALKEMAAIEKEIQLGRPQDYPAIEARLIAVVESTEATAPGKQFACQMLRIVGSPKCVPAVSKLLTDEKLSHIARAVFLRMHDSAVDEALRSALGRTSGILRIGMMNTIGDRGDRQALPALAGVIKAGDEASSRAALNAIGKIGGVEAADLLDRAKVAEPLREAWAHAYLRAAGSVAAAGKSARAEKMYQALFDGNYPAAVRAATVPALAQMQKERAVPFIVKLLSSDDTLMRRAAVSAVMAVPGNAATRAFVGTLARLNPQDQAVLLGALAMRGDAEGVTASINKLAVNENLALQQAAIKALARLGNAESIPILSTALKEGGTVTAEASKSLTELQGNGVVGALIKQSEAGDPVVREAVLKVLAERGQVEALTVFRKAINEQDPQIRHAAIKTLGTLGKREDIAPLVQMLVTSKDASERGLIGQAISEIGGRIPDPSTRCEAVLQALTKADVSTKASLLPVLSSLGGENALQAVRASLAGDAELRKAAVRALADWHDPAPMPDLLSVAKEGNETSDQVMALRGYIRMAGLTGGKAKVQSYREAMKVATRSEEKYLALAGLADVAQPESLIAIEPYLEDPGLNRAAFTAYEKIAESLAGRQASVAREALQRVLEKAEDASLRDKAKAALEKMKK